MTDRPDKEAAFFAEADLLQLSALQHLAFCPRQWGLVYLEHQWADNRLTAEGSVMHDRPDTPLSAMEDGVLVCRGLPLRSLALGLVGRADVVEFHPVESGGVELAGRPGRWAPFPVEYKRGRPKVNRCDEIQLCGQALCLEEMLAVSIPGGALFYGQTRRRMEVTFDDELRRLTSSFAARLHELTAVGDTPLAEYHKKCRSCSMMDICQPKAIRRSGRDYLTAALKNREALE